MTPDHAVEMIVVVAIIAMSSIVLVAEWAERKIRRIIAHAAPANVVTGCTFVSKDGEPALVLSSTWNKDV